MRKKFSIFVLQSIVISIIIFSCKKNRVDTGGVASDGSYDEYSFGIIDSMHQVSESPYFKVTTYRYNGSVADFSYTPALTYMLNDEVLVIINSLNPEYITTYADQEIIHKVRSVRHYKEVTYTSEKCHGCKNQYKKKEEIGYCTFIITDKGRIVLNNLAPIDFPRPDDYRDKYKLLLLPSLFYDDCLIKYGDVIVMGKNPMRKY